MTTAELAESPLASLLRVAVVPGLLAGGVCALIGLLVADLPGLLGAALGSTLVLGFFSTGQVVLQAARSVTPSSLMVIALMTYILQAVVLLGTFAAFRRNPDWAEAVSPTALGLTVIACTAVWTVGLVLASTRARIPLYDTESRV